MNNAIGPRKTGGPCAVSPLTPEPAGGVNLRPAPARDLPADSPQGPRENRSRQHSAAALIIGLTLILFTGCQTPNHYMASTLPSSLRLTSRANPQEVDLSRLASSSGTSQTINSGDFLEISIVVGLNRDDQSKIPARVGDDGAIALNQIGRIPVAGLEPAAAEAMIRMEAINRGLYLDPQVSVQILESRRNVVRVLGAVKEPGTYELPPNASDIVSAIAAAGGLADDAGANVEIRNPVAEGSVPPLGRGGPAVAETNADGITPVSNSEVTVSGGMRSYQVNLISAARNTGQAYTVNDGGVIMVEKQDPAPVRVIGLVRSPGEYEFPVGKDLRVLDALALAGGRSNQVANKIFVIRPLANSRDPAVIEVSLRAAKHSGDQNLLLGPGDVISVEQTPATVVLEALNVVRFGLSGNVATLF